MRLQKYQGLTSEERHNLHITRLLKEKHGGSMVNFLPDNKINKMKRVLKIKIVMSQYPLQNKEVSNFKWANEYKVNDVDSVDNVEDELY